MSAQIINSPHQFCDIIMRNLKRSFGYLICTENKLCYNVVASVVTDRYTQEPVIIMVPRNYHNTILDLNKIILLYSIVNTQE